MSNPPLLDTLLPEILGFHPQLLLDDIINAANEPIYQCTDFVSEFMVNWAQERAKKSSRKEQDEITSEIEDVSLTYILCSTRLTRCPGSNAVPNIVGISRRSGIRLLRSMDFAKHILHPTRIACDRSASEGLRSAL